MDYSEYSKKYDKVSFYEQISRNKFRSWILMISISLIIVLFAYVIAQIYNPAMTFLFLIFGIIFSLSYTLIGYFYSDKISLMSVRAMPAKESDFRPLLNMVEGLALGSGIKPPKLYIMPSKEINAFASGRDPEHAVICVSVGAIENFTKKEMEAVLAHEMTHIVNYDIRFVTLTVVLVGLVSIMAEIFLHSLWFSSGNNNDNKNPIFLILGIILAILAPIFATMLQLAISRKREYMADAGAVKLVRDNSGLISALQKIENYYARGGKTICSKATSNMLISSPFTKSSFSEMFATHPPIKKRIQALEKM